VTSPSGTPSAPIEGVPSSTPTPGDSGRIGQTGGGYGKRLKAILQTSSTQTTRWYVDPGDVQRWAVHRGMTLDPAPGTEPALPWMISTDLDVEEMVEGKLRHRPASMDDVEEWALARNLRLLLDAG